MSETHIRLIAPSGYPHDRAAMTRGVERLQAVGCRVDGLDVLERTVQRFAGTDAERAEDINALASMGRLPDIALMTRGGYGITRLLEHLNYDALRERLAGGRPLLVGQSDFTALQMALYAKSGLHSFSGPLLADLGAESSGEFAFRHFWATLASPSSSETWVSQTNDEVDVQGPLWGGNLAVLCSLFGTPYFPKIDGGILFVEDVGEPPFRIERLLYQLHLTGVLSRQRALILGDFIECPPGPRDNGYDLAAAFAQIRAVARIPVVAGLPHGHGAYQLTLPFGAPARLRVAGGQAQLDFTGYPHLDRPMPVSPAENP